MVSSSVAGEFFVGVIVDSGHGAVVRFASLVPVCVHGGVGWGLGGRQFVGFALRAGVQTGGLAFPCYAPAFKTP
jgi:hypothetical protein